MGCCGPKKTIFRLEQNNVFKIIILFDIELNKYLQRHYDCKSLHLNLPFHSHFVRKNDGNLILISL